MQWGRISFQIGNWDFSSSCPHLLPRLRNAEAEFLAGSESVSPRLARPCGRPRRTERRLSTPTGQGNLTSSRLPRQSICALKTLPYFAITSTTTMKRRQKGRLKYQTKSMSQKNRNSYASLFSSRRILSILSIRGSIGFSLSASSVW